MANAKSTAVTSPAPCTCPTGTTSEARTAPTIPPTGYTCPVSVGTRVGVWREVSGQMEHGIIVEAGALGCVVRTDPEEGDELVAAVWSEIYATRCGPAGDGATTAQPADPSDVRQRLRGLADALASYVKAGGGKLTTPDRANAILEDEHARIRRFARHLRASIMALLAEDEVNTGEAAPCKPNVVLSTLNPMRTAAWLLDEAWHAAYLAESEVYHHAPYKPSGDDGGTTPDMDEVAAVRLACGPVQSNAERLAGVIESHRTNVGHAAPGDFDGGAPA